MNTPNYTNMFLTLAGSHLYGTSTPESDIDLRGVCYMPEDSLIGLQPFDQYSPDAEDTVIYGLNKFTRLAMDCNPNIIEILFAPWDNPAICRECTDDWHKLLDIRSAFVSKKALHTFTGYAFAQLKRINLHHRWLTNPPDKAPIKEDYGAYQDPAGNTKWASTDEHQAYQSLKSQWDQYQDWLKNRNPKRSELERKYLYDTKHGMHLCRLMLQGIELLSDGKLTLPRPEAKWLLEVRSGYFTYEQIVEWATQKESEMKRVEESSYLNWGADFNAIQDVVRDINKKWLDKSTLGGASWVGDVIDTK